MALRNRLLHAHFEVSTDILRKLVIFGLPALLQQFEAVGGVASLDSREG